MAESRTIAVVGLSEGATCGAHDHAVLLAQALERKQVSCTMHWLWRQESSWRATRAQIRGWSRELTSDLAAERPAAVLLHYSVFSYSHRGVPLYVRPVLAALRQAGVPVLSVMHEFVYPWGSLDLRSNLWALSQRAILTQVMGLSRGLVVTTEQRAAWLSSRTWLPRRATVVAPVFSNLPAPTPGPAAIPARPRGERRLVGLFGYSYRSAAVSVVLDALQLVAARGIEIELRLLGGPGTSSGAGESWVAAAAARGMRPPSFSGILPAKDLSDALAVCEVLLFADAPGPSSRKGTLAGSLASGRAVLALDGPQRWEAMVAAGAAELVAARPQALASALSALLQDDQRRESLGARGRAFAERMGAPYSAEVVSSLLDKVLLRADSQFSRAAA